MDDVMNEWHSYVAEQLEDALAHSAGKALISEDTQMALFTANGILAADTRASMRGINADLYNNISMSYRDWKRTQEMTFEKMRGS